MLELCAETIVDIQDKSIFLDAARGLSLLYAEGVITIEDSIFTNSLLLEIYTSATKNNKDPVHLCAATTFKALAFAHAHMFNEAIEMQNAAKKLYLSKSDMSNALVQVYGFDRVAYCAACSLQWREIAGHDYALIEEHIRQVVNDFMICMEHSNPDVVNVIPLVMTMKIRPEMTSQAKSLFEDAAAHTYSSTMEPLLKPTQIVLMMNENMSELQGKLPRLDEQKEIQTWILDEAYMFPKSLELEGLSLVSEMCLYLALSKKKTFKTNSKTRKALIMKGLQLAKYTTEEMSNKGGLYAFRSRQVQDIYDKLALEAPRRKSILSNSLTFGKTSIRLEDDLFLRPSSRTIPFGDWVGSRYSTQYTSTRSLENSNRSSTMINRKGALNSMKTGKQKFRASSTSDKIDRLPNLSEVLYTERYKNLDEEDESSFG